jgi:hypothetical protein
MLVSDKQKQFNHWLGLYQMPIEYAQFRKQALRSEKEFEQVQEMAAQFLAYLRSPEVERQIGAVHQVGAASSEIQKVVLPKALGLGFVSEKKGLFAGYAVSALRPDYYAKVGESGVLLEVERGKTTINNMDLLDLWKCHICEHAEYLFLLVPNERRNNNGGATRPFKQVQNRLGTFFVPRNYVNVEAVFLFGY